MRPSPDQDVGDWKAQRNRKAARHLAERSTRERRAEERELLERLLRDPPGPVNDPEPLPSVN